MARRLLLATLALLGCSRTFPAPRVDAGSGLPAAPHLDALDAPDPSGAFAGERLQLHGTSFSTQPEADQVRVGDSLVGLDAETPPTSTALAIAMPALDPALAGSDVQVTVTVGGQTSNALKVHYRGPGHPQSFAIAPAADLSPTPMQLAATHGVLAVGLAHFPALGLIQSGAPLGEFFRNAPLIQFAHTGLYLDDGGNGRAYFIERAPAGPIQDLEGFYTGSSAAGPESGFFVGPDEARQPERLLASRDALVVLPDATGPLHFTSPLPGESSNDVPTRPWNPQLPVVRQNVLGDLLASTLGTTADGTLRTVAVVASRAAGTGPNRFCVPGSYEPCTGDLQLGVPDGNGGLTVVREQPTLPLRSMTLSPSGRYLVGTTVAEDAFFGALLAYDLSPDAGADPVAVAPVVSLFRGEVAASDEVFANLEVGPSVVRFRNYQGETVSTVPLDGLPVALAVDPYPPNHFFVSVGTPPEVLELDPTGHVFQVTSLHAFLIDLAIAPGGGRAVVSSQHVPRVVPLDAHDLSVQTTYTDVDFTDFSLGAGVTRHLTWLGDDVVCGSYELLGGLGTHVYCGKPEHFPLFQQGTDGGFPIELDPAFGCRLGPVIPDPPVGSLNEVPVRLRALGSDEVAVYTRGDVRAFRVTRPAPGQGFECEDEGELAPGSGLEADWNRLQVSDDGARILVDDPRGVRVIAQRPGGDWGSASICAYQPGPGEHLCPSEPEFLTLSPTGDLAAASFSGAVLVVHLGSSPETSAINLLDLSGDQVLSAAFSPDGRRFYVGTGLGHLYEYDSAALATGVTSLQQGYTPPSPTRQIVVGFPVGSIVPSPDGARLVLLDLASDVIRTLQ